HRTQEPQHLDHRRIDSQHGILLLAPARNAAKAPPPRHREESGSTLQAGASPRSTVELLLDGHGVEAFSSRCHDGNAERAFRFVDVRTRRNRRAATWAS